MKEHRGAFAEQEIGVEAARFDISSVQSHEKRHSLISIVTSVSFIRRIDSTAKEV